MKKVLVFGVFDGIHPGHRAMIKEAKKYGDKLIIAIAPDEVVKILKGLLPNKNLKERMKDLKKEKGVDQVVAGDAKMGEWRVVKEYQPDVIACGYDQEDLKKELEKYLENLEKKPQIVSLKPFKPKKYHSSLLKNLKLWLYARY